MFDPRIEVLTQDSSTAEGVVSGEFSPDVRNRLISHMVADLTFRVLKNPSVDPRGLIITVAASEPCPENPEPEYTIVASAPTA